MVLKIGVLSALLLAQTISAADIHSKEAKPADLFETNRVWNVHVSLTAEEFARMQPRYAGGQFISGASRFQGAEGQRNGLAASRGIEFTYVSAGLEFEGRKFENVAVRYKGNGTFMNSQGSDKISLKVDLNKYVKGQKLAGVTTLNFHSEVTDAGYMNEVLAYRLYRDAGVPSSRTAYARVSITVPGRFKNQYLGLYVLVEDPDEKYFEERFGEKGGAILKPVTQDLFGDWGDDWSQYNQAYDPKTDITDAQKKRVIEFARFLTKATKEDFEARIDSFFDLEAFSRYMAAMMFLCNMDSILANGQNFYVYLHPTTHKFQIIPWDQDFSFGRYGRGGGVNANLSIHQPWRGNNVLLQRVFAVPAFKSLYMVRLREFNQSIFKPQRFFSQVDELAAIIRPAVQDEGFKLANFDRLTKAGQGEYSAGIKQFVMLRSQSITAQLEGRDSGEVPAGFGFGGRGR
jgi:spore coat protein CotH